MTPFRRRKPATLTDAPRSLDEARSRLRLRVYGAAQVGVDRLEATVAGATEGLSVLRQISPDLSIGAAVEVAEGYMKVSADTLQHWDCTLDDLIEATSETADGEELTASRLSDGTILIQDDVSAGRVWAAPEMTSFLPIAGSPIAWALGRGCTLIAGSADPQGMTIAAATLQELLQKGERVESVTPHRLTEHGWEPLGWAQVPDHAHELVERLHMAQVYERQTDPLRALLAARGRPADVNEYAVVRKPDGHPWAVATWTQNASAAVPVADEVILVRSDEATVGIPWGALFAHARDLLEPVTELPARYLTTGFPNDEMVMAALGRS